MWNTEIDFFFRQLAGWAYFGFMFGCIWKLIRIFIEWRREYYGK